MKKLAISLLVAVSLLCWSGLGIDQAYAQSGKEVLRDLGQFGYNEFQTYANPYSSKPGYYGSPGYYGTPGYQGYYGAPGYQGYSGTPYSSPYGTPGYQGYYGTPGYQGYYDQNYYGNRGYYGDQDDYNRRMKEHPMREHHRDLDRDRYRDWDRDRYRSNQ